MTIGNGLLTKSIVITLFFAGMILRLWNINFGLPHSWYADEPEIGEPAIKYTYELRNIIRNNDISKLMPESYVYGTFPVYLYTLLTIIFSKTLGILSIDFSKMDIYVFMRVINALISMTVIPFFLLIIRQLNFIKYPKIFIAGAVLVCLNWKFIVHAHYLNNDILITTLVVLANYFFLRYLQNRHFTDMPESDTINTVIFSVFFGLAISTKITVLITLPLYLYVYFVNKDFRNLFASIFIMISIYVITNPFPVVFLGDFFSRLLEMRYKEAGLVFDSADYSLIKYLTALSWMLTFPVLLLSMLGIANTFKERTKPNKQFYLLMGAQILVYLLFFSIQSRRVDRWLMPILPNLMLFSLLGINNLLNVVKNKLALYIMTIGLVLAAFYYSYYPAILTKQFQRNTPKSASYIWARENLPETSTKFGLTEEGLDPLNKLSFSTIWQYNAYESNGAEFMYPPDPLIFNFVITSSRPLLWTKNPYVVSKYPNYAEKWKSFELIINDANKFKLVKSFVLPKPNLIPLSDVYIYENLTTKTQLDPKSTRII